MKRCTQSELRKMYGEPSEELKDRIHREISSLPIREQEEKIVKKKLFVSAVAILLALAAAAYAATEVYRRVSVNWKGEVITEEKIMPETAAETPVPEDEAWQLAERFVDAAAEGEIRVSSCTAPDGGQAGCRKSIYKRPASLEGLRQALTGRNDLTLPAWIPDGYHFQSAELSFVSKDGYVLLEERQEGPVTLKRYTVEDANVVIDSYDLTLKDDQERTITVHSDLSGKTDADTPAINIPDGDSVRSIAVPGMEDALAIGSAGSAASCLYMRKALDRPIQWKDIPDMPPFAMIYTEERIAVWSSDLDADTLQKMFAPDGC